MKNIVVVGSGFSGSVLARKIAEELDIPVKVIERRLHIAGNMYDEYDEHGFLIQKYGPHHFYTSNWKIWDFLEQYAALFPHYCKSRNFIDGRYVSMPFNFYTLHELVGDAERSSVIINKMRKEYARRDRVPVIEMVESSDPDISWYGNLLFEKSFRPYIAKMWDIPMDKVDRYVLERRSMVIGYDERMTHYDFQGLPKEGFTKLFEKMLDHKNIRVELNTDALEHITFAGNRVLYDGCDVDCLVFTGPIDELFGYKYGKLPYRSLDIRWDYYPDCDSVLPAEGSAYPQAPEYVRKTEYRKMMFDTSGLVGSVVSTEYPLPYDPDADKGNVPYYPVVTEESTAVYQKYVEESKKYGNIFLCGRLAEFRYIDMHTCIEHALTYFENIRDYLNERVN